MLRHFRPKTVENVKIFSECEKSDCYKSIPTRPPVKKIFKIKFLHRKPVCIRELLKKTSMGHCVNCDNILNTAYWAFFLLHVLLCGAFSSCISDLYLLQPEYSYSMMPKLDRMNVYCLYPWEGILKKSEL